jgi:spore photoproduct lyase
MTKLIKKINRKSMLIRPSGRSTDFISPSFGYGCLYDCSYCYMKRHKPKGLDIAENIEDILTTVNNHAYFTPVDKPNQTHPVLTTYDISCNEDFALHAKFYDWQKIFEFFKNHPLAMGSFATKYVNPDFISYDPNKKVRIRYSLMPQHMSDKHEPNTSKILDRIKAVDAFIDAGYEVHLNFSPVIVYKGWRKDYKELFEMVNEYIDYKDEVLAEVIFLTHNKKKHLANLKNHAEAEKDLWIPEIQQNKISQYGGENLRYELSLKKKFIEQFTAIHDSIIPWNKIRYIF